MFTIIEFGLFTYLLEELGRKGWTVKRVANLPHDPAEVQREPLYHYLMKRGDTFTYEPSYSCPMPYTFPSEDAAQAYVNSQPNEQHLSLIPEDV